MRPEQVRWAWPEELPYNDQACPMLSVPVVDSSGRVYFCSQGRVFAMVERDGKPEVLWDYSAGAHVPGAVAFGPDGTLRLHSADGFLHCLTSDGKQAWSPAHVGEPLGWASPLVDDEGNTYLSAYDGGLLRVSPEGRPDRHPYFRSRRKLDSTGLIDQGILYIGAEDGYLFAIELGIKRGRNQIDHASELGYTGGFVNSALALAEDGMLVVAARSEQLLGFQVDGTLAWETPMPGQLLGSPVIDSAGHIYVGVSRQARGEPGRGFLVCVDGNSHKIRWQCETAGPVESSPVVGSDGVIYLGDNTGTIHAVNARGGIEWTARVEAPVRSRGMIIGAGRVAFGLDDDCLVVLECSSQAVSPGGWPHVGGRRPEAV